MSELKPCQMRPERAAEKPQESYDYMTRVMPESKRSQATANLLEAISVAIATLRRAQPANEPLTLDELRGMDGEPVYAVCCEMAEDSEWVIIDADEVWANGKCGCFYFDEYGTAWLAYRRKPERSEEDAKM